MYEIKATFETDQELIEHCQKLDNATKYAVLLEQFDTKLRNIIKHVEDAEIDKMVRYSTECDKSSLRDAIDYCRKLLNEMLDDKNIRMYE